MFGINGFVMGPLVAALFNAFWGIFIREFSRESPITQAWLRGSETKDSRKADTPVETDSTKLR
jgi:hypothetical protein